MTGRANIALLQPGPARTAASCSLRSLAASCCMALPECSVSEPRAFFGWGPCVQVRFNVVSCEHRRNGGDVLGAGDRVQPRVQQRSSCAGAGVALPGMRQSDTSGGRGRDGSRVAIVDAVTGARLRDPRVGPDASIPSAGSLTQHCCSQGPHGLHACSRCSRRASCGRALQQNAALGGTIPVSLLAYFVHGLEPRRASSDSRIVRVVRSCRSGIALSAC